MIIKIITLFVILAVAEIFIYIFYLAAIFFLVYLYLRMVEWVASAFKAEPK